ncbi:MULTISPECIES: succinate--CoA ligase subunit beta [Carboxydocella]|uniref:Citryl-CoA synthetase large subunit n=2 Tax=Carboxydocella TaxID=178898 RepID=A0A1T4N3K9_9FIRM|nr:MULTISPECIES: succinate--CoA ligase subunit beta [Carboxydocella]AVX20902.1 succinyl-CoA synthetase beta subunit/citryl-CoA synthetase large subunit [Carboxydocella thermautotrophica]AVX31317.1 succinyl-CoA synthetase beta subunit/citryl-CoA synthetase large subunit [Carboxydocella thermautotrophica]GAW30462.1 succinate--CoA ligase [Carboxydocella sp. JDF658]SJZ73960.1 citryl-CoA synthetase large subunit [Carboxydocella sporoproducens DSM 16521]
MGRITENHSKQLIRQFGIPAPQNDVAASPEEAREIAKRFGKPVVLKALVPIGKRGKAGAIKFADTPDEASHLAAELLRMKVASFPVERVLVEEKISIAEEWFVSITIDKSKKAPVIIASTCGGIDVEELSRKWPEKIITYHVDPILGFCDYEAKEIWSELGVKGKLLTKATGVLSKLYRLFDSTDAYLLEINPLVVTTDEDIVAAASVMSVDDSAMYRHPELKDIVQIGSERAWRPLTELEKQMIAVNEADPYRGTARYTEMDGGDIGFMCGGGGGSLLSFDALVSFGGKPANYSEVGGNPTEEKVYGLTRGILSKPGVKGLFVAHNITNNTQVDIMAKGIIRALKDLNIDPSKFPVVVREAGVNDAVAKELFVNAGIEYYGDDVTITEAAAKMVQRMKETYGE